MDVNHVTKNNHQLQRSLLGDTDCLRGLSTIEMPEKLIYIITLISICMNNTTEQLRQVMPLSTQEHQKTRASKQTQSFH